MVLTLWTVKGAARHAKMLTTEKAWEVFEELEDVYFRVKQSAVLLPDFSNPAIAARAWADQVEARLLAESNKAKVDEQLAIAAPKIEALDRIATLAVAHAQVTDFVRYSKISNASPSRTRLSTL